MDSIDVYKTFHHKETKYTFFPNAHGTFPTIDCIIGHKMSLNNFKKIEIILSMCTEHNGSKLENNLKEKTQKHSSAWRMNNILLNNEYNEIKEEIKNYLETNENEYKTT